MANVQGNGQNAKRAKAPYRGNARQRIQPFGSAPWVSGGTATVDLPRVGMLSGIHVRFAGGMTRGGGDNGNFKDQFFNFAKRLTVETNLGAGVIYDMSGHMTNCLNQMSSFNYAADLGGDGTASLPAPLATTADPAVWAGLVTNPQTNQELLFTWFIPIAINDGVNFSIGQINLQAPEVQVTLKLQMGTIAGDLFEPGAVVAGTTVQGTFNFSYVYYEVPNPTYVQYPPYIVHRCLEATQGVFALGDQLYTVPRQGTLLRLAHSLVVDDLTSDATDALTIEINKTDKVYRENKGVNRFLSRLRYGHKMPRGLFVHDFFAATGLPASGDYRDTIDTEQISTLESTVNIPAGVVLGIGNNFLNTMREFTQKLMN